MSATITRGDTTLSDEPGRIANQLVPPLKLRRRPALVAGAVVAVCLGALLAAWAWTATTRTQDVLVARQTISRGSVIRADDLARVRLSADPALRPVPASEFDQVVGKRAALDIAAGGMVTSGSFTSTVVPGAGDSVVGVVLKDGQEPGLGLHNGDHVRVVVTPGQGDELPPGVPVFTEADVVAVHTSEDSGSSVVDLLVPSQDAAVLAVRVATGNVALVLDSRER